MPPDTFRWVADLVIKICTPDCLEDYGIPDGHDPYCLLNLTCYKLFVDGSTTLTHNNILDMS